MKNLLFVVIFVAASVAAFLVVDDEGLENLEEKTVKNEGTKAVVVSPIKRSGFQLLGHEDSVMKGAAFTDPAEDPSLKSTEWVEQSINYATDVAQADLAISLDQQLYGLFLDDINEFSKANKVTIAVNAGTCGVSSKELGKKSVDMGGFCCPPGKPDRLPSLKYHTLGISSIALLLHPDNKLKNISRADARKVFGGKIKRWNKLPDNEDPQSILVATRLHCKTRPGHWSLIVGKEDDFSLAARETGDISYMLTQVNRHPALIGYETLYMVEQEAKAVNVLPVDNVSPSDLTALAEGRYPFYRVFNVTTWAGKNANPLANKLVEHLRGLVAAQSEKYKMAPVAELEKHGWLVKNGELIGEPGKVL